jgi:hypothetical protein
MTRRQELQRLIRKFKEETGDKEVDMHKVAGWLAKMGWKLPAPKTPLELLAGELSSAAREEFRQDPRTGRSYRANHAYTVSQGGQQLHLWVDIDEAPRFPMLKSLQKRREQTVGDLFQCTIDAEHWNGIHPEEEPIVIETDLGPDVEWKKNAPDDEAA